MTGEHYTNSEISLPANRRRRTAPDWSQRRRAAPTRRQLEAALARLRQRCPEGFPARIEALLEDREIAFVVATFSRCRGAQRRLEQMDAALYRAALEAARG